MWQSELFTQGVEINPSPNSWILSWTSAWTAVSHPGSQTEECPVFIKGHMNTWVPLCRGLPTWLTHRPTSWARSSMRMSRDSLHVLQPSSAPSKLCLLISSYFTLILLPSCPLWTLWSFSYTQISPRCASGCTLNYWHWHFLSLSCYKLAFPRFNHNLLIRCWEMMFGVWKR